MTHFSLIIGGFKIGGYDGSNYAATTEILQSNGAVSAGPSLPNEVYGHCMVTRIDGMVTITGGSPSSNRKVWIFNPNDESYEDGPQMINVHRRHACALFKSAMHNYREVVLVAGGLKEDTVEIWDYQTQGSSWLPSKCNFVFACSFENFSCNFSGIFLL